MICATSLLDRVRALVEQRAGVHPPADLIRARLSARLRQLGLNRIDDYLERLESREEVDWLVDALTIHKTSFFREARHYEFLRESVLPVLAGRGASLRLWSAGCATGEEPYSLAMVLCETLPSQSLAEARILGTDVSPLAIAKARRGIYAAAPLADLSAQRRRRFFERLSGPEEERYGAGPALRELVRLAPLNLLSPWPMRGPFDLIFCRNVMIYFPRATRLRLLAQFRALLRAGGHLFLGLSESLDEGCAGLRYVQPSVYAKTEDGES